MDGIDRIIAHIEGDAMQEAEEIKTAAALRCEELRARCNKAAQEKYWNAIRDGVKDCELLVRRMGSAAALEAKKSILSLKQEMADRAFGRAKELLRALPEDEYAALLARLAEGAARTGREEIILCPADCGTIAKRVIKAANERLAERGLPGKLSLSKETRDIYGGLILKSGDIEVNCSIGALTGMYRREMAAQVADAMFG